MDKTREELEKAVEEADEVFKEAENRLGKAMQENKSEQAIEDAEIDLGDCVEKWFKATWDLRAFDEGYSE